MLFSEYRNHRVATLHKEAGEPFSCFHDPNGLPYKFIYHPFASELVPGREDQPSDMDIKMRLVAPRGGDKLETYLVQTLGLQKNVDFHRHHNSERGGLLYFDILTDTAIDKLAQRAQEVGQDTSSNRVERQGTSRSGPIER